MHVPVVDDPCMAPPDGARAGALRWAGLLVVVWLATALAVAMPAWLLLHFAESRLPQAAGIALVLAAVMSGTCTVVS
jgi:hypothetical protein